MDAHRLREVVKVLRDEGSDNAEIEARLAQGGLPTTMASTLSALANRPGGGIVVLGLDEKAGFVARGVPDAPRLAQALVARARQALDPAVHCDVSVLPFEGVDLVAAEVVEAATLAKPVRVGSGGPAYLRGDDGDYRMSDLEAQAFIANRGTPRDDREAVEGATVDDLDPALVADYLRQNRNSSRTLSRFDDDEILRRTGVITLEGVPTVAGVLALGLYPQQFFPALVIRASAVPAPGDPEGTRAGDLQEFDGPIPAMIEDAAAWVRRTTRT